MIRLVGLALLAILSSTGCGSSEPEAKEPRHVALGEPSDDIDPALIGEAVRGNSMQIQRCYAAASEANPSLQGQVEVRFLVNTDGSIGQAMVASTNLPSHVATCVVNAFYALKLPEQAEPVIAQYPVFFHPG
jgi:hypothetical protein